MEQYALLPLQINAQRQVVIATSREQDGTITDELQRVFELPVAYVPANDEDIQAAIMGARRAGEVEANGGDLPGGVATDAGELRARATDAPVIQLINAILGDALRTGASDVHLESTRDGLRVRMRLDGVLRDVSMYAGALMPGAISRVKLLAGLDIAERRLPQDGRARVRMGAGGREVDVRVSTLPGLHGEGVVLRILDQGGAAREGARSLEALGMPGDVQRPFEEALHRTSGLVLVTGPTGSGKTTTLYAALSQLNKPGVKIITVEDPVEYQLPGVMQIPVNRKAGLGFAAALRSMLRHDPDIVMVGEMRDRETAEIAIQAALTGHLVFSTLHTNDAASGVTRLVDMGVEPYLVSATVQVILAQRLVRVVCSACQGAGCAACAQSGYKGRTGLYELLTLDDASRATIVNQSGADVLREQARRNGVRSLSDHGAQLVEQGVTTQAEVLRVTG
jgi:type II secretory ATPase GspE/PulE/Tfp pilus assembly ATPase PilB-like protein